MSRRPVELHLVRCSPDLYSVQSIDEVLAIHLNAWSVHFTLDEAEATIAKLKASYEAKQRTVQVIRKKA